MLLLEILGAIFSILGAFLMSRSSKNDTRPLYFAFISFFMSNLALFTFFTYSGKIPIMIQMFFFFVTAIIGIYKLTNEKKRDSFLMIVTLVIYISIIFIFVIPDMSKAVFSILPLDFTASFIAIFGSYLLSSHKYKIRSYAFICFFVADLIFVYIGYINQFYFFMIQSIFYLYTSTRGYLNTMEKELKISNKLFKQ